MVVTQSAAAAYRADLVSRGGPFGSHDGGWIAVGTMLEHATLAPEPERQTLIRGAITLAGEILGEADLARLGDREWQDRDRGPADAIVLLSEAAQQAGALNVAALLLDALTEADTSLNTVQQGRIVAKRANVAWKMGRIDEATDRYHRVEQMARQVKSVELKVRAWIGFVGLAQMRGNYPEVFRYSRRAARLADRAGMVQLARAAHNGLMIAAGVAQRFDEALVHGWKVYQASRGDPIHEGEGLQNLGQALLDSGHVDEARAAFASVVSRELPARIMLPALGSLALASAATGRPLTVEWASNEVERVEMSTAPQYALAAALLESASALGKIGRSERAERCRGAALHLAQIHSFHEIAYRAEGLQASTLPDSIIPRQRFSKGAATVAQEVRWMEPERLPPHVRLAIAPV